MQRVADGLPRPVTIARIGLIAFVLAWLFGPDELQSAVPIWVPFLIALGLEVQFFVGAIRAGPSGSPDRGPLAVDQERYGYKDEADELLLVREGENELWIPYAGETPDDVAALIDEARDQPVVEAVPTPSRERPRIPPAARRFAAGLAVIFGLVVVFWLVESRTGWNGLDADSRAAAEARFSREASLVADKPVTIRCDDSGEHVGAVQHADGVAVVGGDLAYLTPERCLALYRLAFDGEASSNQTGRAIVVLAHESWHLRGVADEGATECYALQSGVEIGRRLGLSAPEARRLMRGQLAENALRGRASPAYLLSGECRDGGRLDLHRGVSDFP